MSRAFSTREVAQMWDVSESTIKRWADAGTLPCTRTPGGHRRFLLEQIQGFQNEHGFKATGLLKMRQWEKPEPSTAESSIPPEGKCREIFLAAQENRRAMLVELLQKLYLRGLTLFELYDSVVLPLEQQLRDGQESGQHSLGQAQIIRNNLEDALHRLFADAVWRPASGSLGMCGALDRRRPLALNGLVRILEAEGWDCLNLGEGIQFEHLAQIVEGEPVNLICIASNVAADPLEAGVGRLARLTHAYRIPVFLFGSGFTRALVQNFTLGRRITSFASLRSAILSLNRGVGRG